MLNWILALVTVIIWVTAYVWYAAPDIQNWWRRRRERRTQGR